jgi:hypothetical protein
MFFCSIPSLKVFEKSNLSSSKIDLTYSGTSVDGDLLSITEFIHPESFLDEFK